MDISSITFDDPRIWLFAVLLLLGLTLYLGGRGIINLERVRVARSREATSMGIVFLIIGAIGFIIFGFLGVAPTLPSKNASTTTPVAPIMRPQYTMSAGYVDVPPKIDGFFDEWSQIKKYPITEVVFGAKLWRDSSDLSGTVMASWDEEYLYLALNVVDDQYMQNERGKYLYKGDSIEVLLDTDVSGDFNKIENNEDDYQLIISPGNPKPGKDQEAYLGYPQSLEGVRSQVESDAILVDDGYKIEIAIPWNIFDVKPSIGQHFGFVVSISDNDRRDASVQQSMVSYVPIRKLDDPTTWGDLTLAEP